MTATRLRPLAEVDVVERTRYYRQEGGDELGAQFFDAAISALDAIARMPEAGSPRVGELFGIPGLRFRRVARFPCGWFYFIAADHVDVVRLLADAQDLPVILADVAYEQESVPGDLAPSGRVMLGTAHPRRDRPEPVPAPR